MPMSLVILLLLSLFFSIVFNEQLTLCYAEKQQQSLSSKLELEALYSLRASLGIRTTNWPIKANPCTNWTGVECQAGRVVSLNLTGLRRTRLARRNPGFYVDGLQNLTSLAKFTAAGFPLPGPIPIVLTRASSLSYLDLSGCSINGTIPPKIAAGLRNLTHLDLSFNSLSGSLPEFLESSKLRILELGHNKLSGAIPNLIWYMPNLTVLDLSNNDLNGTFVAWISDNISFTGELFNLSGNSYYGKISPSFQTILSRFRAVDLSGNYFRGEVRLVNASLSNNCFSSAVNQKSSAVCEGFYGEARSNGKRNNETISDGNQKKEARSDGKRKKIVLGVIIGGIALFIVAIAMVTVCLWKCRGTAARPRDIGDIADRPKDSSQVLDKEVVILDVQTELRQEVVASQPPSQVVLLPSRIGDIAAGPKNSSRERNEDVVVLDAESEPRQDVVASQPPLQAVLPPSRTASLNLPAVGYSFAYDELAKATSGFSGGNLIKQGHSGELYLGVLEDSTGVVVKRINLELLRRETFRSELDVFAKSMDFSGARLVPFLGHCLQSDTEKFLVYKYMQHRDLASALHKKSVEENDGLQSLDWITRLKIGVGIAEALSFLHHECSPPLVHRDLEASSILLDDKYEVYLGSLSEICAQQSDSHHSVFSRILRPSQIFGQGISGSSTASCAYDIYCMGKVLLELITGKLGISGSNNAVTNAWIEQTLSCINIHNRSSINKILDRSLKVEEDHLEEVLAVAIITKSCLDPKPSKRPPARYVLRALENPLKVARMQNNTNPAWLRTSSSRRSWHGAFIDSFQRNSSQAATSLKPRQELRTSGLSGTETSQTSSGDRSVSRSRASREIVPEP